MIVQSLSDIDTSINRLIDSWCERYRPESMNTDWGQALLAYGLATASRATGNANGREYIRRWSTYHLSAGVPLTYFVGSWGPGLLFPEIIDDLPEFRHELVELARRLFRLITCKAIRNGEGLLLHNVDLPHIYIDTIYYTAPVLAKLGGTLGREDWKEEAMNQLRWHLEILRDPDSPFFLHCRQNLSELPSEGAWGRGNGWVTMTCAELLVWLKDDPESYHIVEAIATRMFRELVPLQTSNGLWRTILNDPGAYEETSASAMFLFSMIRGMRFGIMTEELADVVERGIGGLIESIDSDGRFTKTSEGTWPGTADYYRGLDTGEWWWGTGAALLAFTEYRQWRNSAVQRDSHR